MSSNFGGFLQKKLPHAKQVSEEQKQKANGFRFQATGLGEYPLETHLESSKEQLIDHDPLSKPSVAHQTTKPGAEKHPLGRRSPHHDRAANTTRRRSSGKSKRVFARPDFPDYLSSDSETEHDSEFEVRLANDGGLDAENIEAAKDTHKDVLKEFGRAYAKVQADREARSKASGERRIRTPDSYPQSSEGQPTEKEIFPPQHGISNANTGAEDQQNAYSKFRHASNAGNGIFINDTETGSHQTGRIDSTNDGPFNSNFEPRNYGYDGHGPRQAFGRTSQGYRNHSRRNSLGPTSIIRKPPPRTPLPSHVHGPINDTVQPSSGPHIGKALDVLGASQDVGHAEFDAPTSSLSARKDSAPPQVSFEKSRPSVFRYESFSTGPTQPEFAGLLPPNEPSTDYDADALHKKDFASLTAEPFDTDPRNPRLSSDSVDVAREVKNLIKTLKASSPDTLRDAEDFFASLTLLEWNEAGQLLSRDMNRAREELAKKRAERRDIAKKFEDEVARREKAVQHKIGEINDEMSVMKQSGGRVLESRSPSQGKKRRCAANV